MHKTVTNSFARLNDAHVHSDDDDFVDNRVHTQAEIQYVQ